MERYIRYNLEKVLSQIPRLAAVHYIPDTTVVIADIKQSGGRKIKITLMNFDNGHVTVSIFDRNGTLGSDTTFYYDYYKNNYNGNYEEIGTAISSYIDAVLGPYNEESQ